MCLCVVASVQKGPTPNNVKSLFDKFLHNLVKLSSSSFASHIGEEVFDVIERLSRSHEGSAHVLKML
jgi:hypothetical protein